MERDPSQAAVSVCQVVPSAALISTVKEVMGEALSLGAVQSRSTLSPEIVVVTEAGVSGIFADNTVNSGE